MIASEHIDFNEDLLTIIKKKRKFHEDQIAFHQHELAKLSSFNTPSIPFKIPSTLGNGNESTGQYDKPWWWEKNIPTIVNASFPNEEFMNKDLMQTVVKGINDPDFKKAVRYAISMGLKANIEKGFLIYREETGVKGYIYKKK